VQEAARAEARAKSEAAEQARQRYLASMQSTTVASTEGTEEEEDLHRVAVNQDLPPSEEETW
jgi:hypothetical protein